MPDAPFDRTGPLAQELLELTARITARAEEDPFGNPVLLVALAISRRIDAGALDDAAIAALIGHLRDAAFADRARRIADYVGGTDTAAHIAALRELAQRLVRPDPNDSPVRWAEYRALVERTRFAAVFTAHPTFALPAAVAQALAETASGRPTATEGSHRPPPITLANEFAQAGGAIAHGRDAHRPVQCRAAVGGAQRLAGSLDRARPAAGDPVELGRLRHRRPHRYRLVGHAAAAAGDEAPAARAAACPGRRVAGNRGAGRAHRRGAGGGRRAARRSARTRPIRRGSPPSPRHWWGGAKPR